MSNPVTRILFIQHELDTWQRAKMWGYTWHLGIEEGFADDKVEFTTLITSWFPFAKEICAGQHFDQVWLNDITHVYEPGGCGGYQLQAQDMEWIAGIAPIRLGFLTESLNYTKEEYESNPALIYARQILNTTGRYMTHIMTPDEKDVPLIQDLHEIPVSWFVTPTPGRLICKHVTAPPPLKPVFRGTPYGERARWLDLPELKGLINSQPSADNFTGIPQIFDELQALAKKTISAGIFRHTLYEQYLLALRRIRLQSFEMYLKSLEEGSAVINLPSFGKIHTARVYEGMAAGRPVITIKPEDRPKLNALFEDGKDVLLYSRNHPSRLAEHIRHLFNDREFGRWIATNARDKLVRYHTTELRVTQFLRWIQTGAEPVYGSETLVEPSSAEQDAPEDRRMTSTGERLPLKREQRNISAGASRESERKRDKLRILFISPPYLRLLGLGNSRFPLSFGHMATMLSMNGHTAAIHDADFDKHLIGRSATYEASFSSQGRIAEALADRDHFVWKEIEQQIRSFQPDVVGITTMTSKFPMAMRVAEIVKALDPHIRVVAGGHHASIFGRKLVHDKNIDFAVVGEGEMTMLELVNRLCDRQPDFSGIRGLVYKNGDGVVDNGPRELLCNLDVLPIADRNLVINDGFVTENNIMTSRGCPFNCSYCGAQVLWQRKVRRRSVDGVVREIKYLFDRGRSRFVNFWDDSFTCDRKFTHAITNELKKFDGLRFSCITRLDLIDNESLVRLKEAGCTQILFGVESGSDAILKRIDKKMTRELIKRKTAMVDAVGIPWLGFFIMGYPGETREDILGTLAFMKELNPSFAEINIFNPLPGTRIWNDLERQNKVSSDMDFSKYSQASTENFFGDNCMTKEEFRELALFMAREFDKHNRNRHAKP
jgi:radical SAM superfamily enzyme YgiQ (UPF0313 family)